MVIDLQEPVLAGLTNTVMLWVMEPMILEQRFMYLYIFADKCEYIYYSYVGVGLRETFAFPLCNGITGICQCTSV